MLFTLYQEGRPLPYERWAWAEGAAGSLRRALATLGGLVDQEAAQVTETGDAVFLPHAAVARLHRADLLFLGLPEPAPYRLAVDSRGTVDQPGFQFSWRLLTPSGRPVLAPQQEGAFLLAEGRRFTLLDPLYTALSELRRFATNPPQNLEDRLLFWANLKRLLTEEVVVDRYLSSLNAVRASAFTLEVRLDEQGQPTFDPILVHPQPRDGGDEGEGGAQPLLPRAYQETFARYFRTLSRVRVQYPLGGGWHVILDPLLCAALEVVRRTQDAPPAERRRFLQNPYAALRAHLEEHPVVRNLRLQSAELEQLLGHLFVETTTFSERVQGIGVRPQKVIPWLVRPTHDWLPPAEGEEPRGGIAVGGTPLALTLSEAAALRRELEDAMAEGKPAVIYRGIPVPATEQAREAIAQFQRAATAAEGEIGHIVLLIKDNIDELLYQAAPRPHRTRYDTVPARVRTPLKPHQRDGLRWLQAHWQRGSPGALLADDMGLGKTLQTLAFLAWLQEEMESGHARRAPFLIVAPVGLLSNWEAEHDTHLEPPGLGYRLRAHGAGLHQLRRSAAGRGELAVGAPLLDVEALQRADWVLTTYETLRDYQHSFGRIRWAVIVYDEAQRIKNPAALVTDAAKAMQAEFVLALTGTPVENSLADLWCIMDTVQPGILLDLKSFCRKYEVDIHDPSSLTALQQLKRQIDESEPEPPHHPKPMLRRLKVHHLPGLPPKKEIIHEVTMEGIQLDLYNQVICSASASLGYRKEGIDESHILQVIHELRDISLHPYLRTEDWDRPDEECIQASARFRALIRVLDDIAGSGEKALIFVDRLIIQQILAGIIQRRYHLPRPPLVIHGGVAGHERKKRVDEFMRWSGFDVLILSPRAAGVGFNLTAANHVIHLSRWWNPAVEDQCTDRVYRLGQEKTVFVYHLFATHPQHPGRSFDENLHRLIENKRKLSRALRVPSVVSQEDLRELYGQTVAPGGAGP